MLTLEPPYPVIDGYALLPDHADERLWYALPATPRLALSGDGRPQLSITQYLGGRAGTDKIAGGDPAAHHRAGHSGRGARRPRREAARGGARPTRRRHRHPVPFDAGTVELAVLGRTSSPAADGSAAPGGPFEVIFSAGGRPSLGGCNEASFQVVLNAAAAELLDKALDTPELPLLVTYAMTFAALRPGFTMDIEADWSKVYSSLRNQVNANAWITAADVDVSITKALENSGVDMNLVVLGGEGSA